MEVAEMAAPHNFEIGRWVRLLKGPHAGRRGQIVSRRGDELELLVRGGPEWPFGAGFGVFLGVLVWLVEIMYMEQLLMCL
jgi:hypothetical protein